jgi:hypothetical protein
MVWYSQTVPQSQPWQNAAIPGATIKVSARGEGKLHDLSGLTLHWSASDVRGCVVAHGVLPWFACTEAADAKEAGSSPWLAMSYCTFRVSLPLSIAKVNAGLWLKVFAELAKDSSFAFKGHVVAEETAMLVTPAPLMEHSAGAILCPGASAPLLQIKPALCGDVVRVHDIGDGVQEVHAASYTATVCGGEIVSLKGVDGLELLSSEYGKPIDHAFWRLPTDNDRGGIDVFLPQTIAPWLPLPRSMTSLARQWRQAGLMDSTTSVREVSWSDAQMVIHLVHGVAG